MYGLNSTLSTDVVTPTNNLPSHKKLKLKETYVNTKDQNIAPKKKTRE